MGANRHATPQSQTHCLPLSGRVAGRRFVSLIPDTASLCRVRCYDGDVEPSAAVPETARVAAMGKGVSAVAMVRSARSAPHATLDEVAGAAGVSKRVLLRGLRSVSGRGRCDSMIVERFSSLNAPMRAAATVVAAGPPSLLRLAAQDSAQRVTDTLSCAGAGTATWATRSYEHPAPTRRIAASASGNSRMASDPNLPAAVLGRIACDSSIVAVKSTASENAACPPYALAALAATDTHAAAHPRCPSYVIGLLAGSDDEELRRRAARNPNCAPETVARLVADRSVYVRQVALENPNCPPGVLQKAAGSDVYGDQEHAVYNPACGAETLDKVASVGGTWARVAVLQHPNCAASTVQTLAHDPNWELREAAAGSEACPQSLIGGFAYDRSWHVRAAVAARGDCPHQLLAVLAKDDEEKVVAAVTSNPACSSEILADVKIVSDTLRITNANNPACSPRQLESLARFWHSDTSMMLPVAKNPNCPPLVLAKLAVHNSPIVALAAVKAMRERSRPRP